MSMSNVKVGLAFLFFFGLFYVEPVRIGPISIAILWKVVLLSVLFFALLSRRGNIRLHRMTAWGLLFALAGIFNESLFLNPVETISSAVKNAYIPILFGFWLHWVSGSEQGEELNRKVMLGLSAFILISTIPFLLKIISPISEGYDLSLFSDVGGMTGFIGIFQNAHGASMTLTVASVTILWSLPYVRKKSTRLLYLAFVTVGLGSSVLTLVRTGLAMFGAAILTLLATSRNGFHFRLALALFIGSIAAAFYLFETSETFRLRMLGLNTLMVQQDVSLTQIGSGRFLYWMIALEGFFSSPFIDQVFGFGPTVARDLMYEAIGLRIYAHNGFIDILQFYGYFGLFAYVMMLRQFFRILFALQRSNPYFVLLAIHLIAYLVGMLVQGERYFLVDALFVLSLVGATVARRHSAAETCQQLTNNVNEAAE
jgi:hypothetical protein